MGNHKYHNAECHFDERCTVECHYTECRNAECHYTKSSYTKCQYAECCYAECHCTVFCNAASRHTGRIMLSGVMPNVVAPYIQLFNYRELCEWTVNSVLIY